jgi:type II secretory ATPase GspE/PulE/Tfp pilus assembly ATPase PilB-like protein
MPRSTIFPTAFDARSASYAADFVDRLLAAASAARATDIHLQPLGDDIEVRWRIDGVLQSLGRFPRGATADVIARVKVLAQLLTYQSDLPQEGRLARPLDGVDMRVSTFPTLHGERVAIRLFAAAQSLRVPSELGLPADVLTGVENVLASDRGALIISGPAGSGKTTTAYACLRALAERRDVLRNIVTLEDPIEGALEGVVQSQVKPNAGFTLAAGLRALLRQDPEVILVGEVRDPETAREVFQASLTGHLVLSTFHAGSVAETIARLLEMDLEPHLLRSGLSAVLCQRLVRKLCSCSRAATSDDELLGLAVNMKGVRLPVGCDACWQTGYLGRTLLVEFVSRLQGTLTAELLQQRDTRELALAAERAGMVGLRQSGVAAVSAGTTSAAEMLQVLGQPR